MKVHMIEKIFERISTFFEDFFIFLQFNCSEINIKEEIHVGGALSLAFAAGKVLRI